MTTKLVSNVIESNQISKVFMDKKGDRKPMKLHKK